MKTIVFMVMLAVCGCLCLAQESVRDGMTALPKIVPPPKPVLKASEVAECGEASVASQDTKSFEKKFQSSWVCAIVSAVASAEYFLMKEDKDVQDMLRNTGRQAP